MTAFFKPSALIATVFMIGSAAFGPAALASKEVGNGGDQIAIEFVDLATSVLSYLKQVRPPQIDLARLEKAISTVLVESTDEALVLRGAVKDAINFPEEAKILVNRSAWAKRNNDRTRAVLALHEYLGILGVDDTAYRVSSIALNGLGLLRGADAEVLIDVLDENRFAIDEAVHGVTRMASADSIECEATADNYRCTVRGPMRTGRTGKAQLTGRKARELWTLVTGFGLTAQRGPESIGARLTALECQGENTRLDKPAFCVAHVAE